MEAVGLGIGGVSLLFQIFAGCIKGIILGLHRNNLTDSNINAGYQLFSEAKGLETNYQFFRVRFKTEQYRLLDWATIAQLSENDETLVLNKASRSVLLDVLDQQYRLMLRFGRLDDRLRPLTKPLLFEVQEDDSSNSEHFEEVDSLQSRFPHTNVLLKKSLDFIHGTSKVPSRLRWAISDKAKIEDVLNKLTSLNDYLNELLNNQQLQSLTAQHTRTSYQIMQLNNKVDHLCELIAAGRFTLSSPEAHGYRNTTDHKLEASLASLAQFKALMSVIETASLTEKTRSKLGLNEMSSNAPLRIPTNEIEILDKPIPKSANRVSAKYKPADASWRRVWIEWKSISATTDHKNSEANHRRTLKRFEALVELLRQDHAVREFSTMRCLGYCVQGKVKAQLQYGFVFENPQSVDPAAQPTSLEDHLLTSSIPSLTTRVGLMKALVGFVEKLHAVNWLHKGLRSQNVVFFPSYHEEIDLTNPYLSGFDYSRPENANDMSETAPTVASEDLYRHPAVQGEPKDNSQWHGFKKYHDIYSLGIILLEIAYWDPIYKILGYCQAEDIKPSELVRVRMRLLGTHDSSFRGNLGDVIADAILACLSGPSGKGEFETTGFFEAIVQNLQQVVV
ncbi:hypothetical protein FSARC_12195 [Fusarium sarcochroum]|uniref:Prion-inhibition and propagation HeLo domain-containing protein n=1 Tax=Fusarium sarcochroum TaxID=1208366 RepID=A0A8H4WXA7_9HYPO|nr:hypothetical protein FSARC_12195 [Fusarium sarcochroum]